MMACARWLSARRKKTWSTATAIEALIRMSSICV